MNSYPTPTKGITHDHTKTKINYLNRIIFLMPNFEIKKGMKTKCSMPPKGGRHRPRDQVN